MMLVAGTKLRPYELQSPLGTGRMREVWRAHDIKLSRAVAIKTLPPDSAALAYALREHGAVKRLEVR